jgi:hypothetical protein
VLVLSVVTETGFLLGEILGKINKYLCKNPGPQKM